MSKNNKGSFFKTLKRSLIIFIGNVLGITIIAWLGLGIEVDYFNDIIVFVIFLSIINSLLWPILTKIFMPFLVLTFGIGSLIMNGALIEIFGPLFNFEVSGWGIILAPISMAAVTTILSSIVTIDSDSSYYRSVIRDAKKKRPKEAKTYPGLIIVEIDGLAHNVLKEAVEQGFMPTVKELIDSKSHTLREWECDMSSQTGASQAGILHGNNKGVIAFRWIEKSNDNQMIECSSPQKVKTLENRISDGNGLLSKDGASRSNLFSGDTDDVIFTLSKILDLKKLYNKAWYSVFSNPNNFARIVFLFFADMVSEIWSQIMHRVHDIRPRIKRSLSYTLTRAGTNVFIREITTSTIIGDMMIGKVDIVYSTYPGYDEIAHHSGVRDKDAWNALKNTDKQIQRLMDAVEYAPRPYQFVIQSDHGQGNGATFKQRYGQSFEELVKSLIPDDLSIYANMSSNEDHYAEAFHIFSDDSKKENDEKYKDSHVIVLASGNLSMIYLTQWSYRLTYEEIQSMFPDLIPGIVNNEYVGFIAVKSSEKGELVIGKDGIYNLDTGEIEGENPLKDFGKNAAKHVKRHTSFEHTPDILVNSFYDLENNEICAFEELVGSHGGMGGEQTKPFILYPSDWKLPSEDIVGAESVYHILKENNEKLKNV